MNSLKAFVIEDESAYAIFFEKALSQLNFDVVTAINADEANAAIDKFIKEKNFPDICIVDERISDKKNAPTGLDLIKTLVNTAPTALILISNWRYESNTIDKAKKLNIASKFRISKDIFKRGFEEGKEEFQDIVKDCVRDFRFDAQYRKSSYTKDYERFGFKDGMNNSYFFFNFDSIVYLESGETSSQCKLYFKDGTHQLFNTNVGTIARQISMFYYPFAKVNKSLYVNLNEISSIVSNTLTMANGANIPISDAQSQMLRENFFMLHT